MERFETNSKPIRTNQIARTPKRAYIRVKSQLTSELSSSDNHTSVRKKLRNRRSTLPSGNFHPRREGSRFTSQVKHTSSERKKEKGRKKGKGEEKEKKNGEGTATCFCCALK